MKKAAALFVLLPFALLAQTPDTFTWNGGSNYWDAADVWTTTSLDRTAPGIAGDTVRITGTTKPEIYLSNDVTIQRITHLSTANSVAFIAPDRPVTLNLGGDTPTATNRIHSRLNTTTTFGTATDNQLTLNLKGPLWIAHDEGGTGSAFIHFRAPITSDPGVYCPIYVTNNYNAGNSQWIYNRPHFLNPGNTFYGDIIIGTPSLPASGAHENSDVRVAPQNSSLAANLYLGDLRNKIILRNRQATLNLLTTHADGFNRQAEGWGTIKFSTDGGNTLRAGIIGPNAILSPCTTTNEYGLITINASAITFSPTARVVFDVSTTANDSIKLTPSSKNPFTYTGAVEIREQGNVPVGSQFMLMQIQAATASAFTFAPSYKTPNYSYKRDGDSVNGWRLIATKIYEGDATAPIVQNLPAYDLADTQATVVADVIATIPDNTADIRVYYGTADGGSDPAAWDHCLQYPAAATEAAIHNLTITEGLQPSHTYYYRHSLSNSAGETFSLDRGTFYTTPWTTPDKFTYVATNSDWFVDDAWSTTTPYLRKIPQCPGDEVTIDFVVAWNSEGRKAVSRTLNLTQDATLQKLILLAGEGASLTFSATNGPATLIFAPAQPGQINTINTDKDLNYIAFGLEAANEQLTLRLDAPLEISRATHGGAVNIRVPLTGGTPEAPSHITLQETTDYGTIALNLYTLNNTLRGDYYIGNTANTAGVSEFRLGHSTLAAADSMLGHPDNQIHLRNQSLLTLYTTSTTPAQLHQRTLRGTGTLRAHHTSGSLGSLHLDGTTLAPYAKANPDNPGTLTLNATGVTDTPSTQYTLRLNADGTNDKLNYTGLNTPLTLTGQLNLPEATTLPQGQLWDIITIPAGAGGFISNLVLPKGYRRHITGDATAGWILSVERHHATILQLR